MAPPTNLPKQAGRFKPRKPAAGKKSAATGTSSKSTTGGAQSNPDGDARGRSPTRGGRVGGRGRGLPMARGRGRGRGRGRDGGRGGRSGRGRIPLPRGQVFFTGDATATASTAKKSSAEEQVSTEAKVSPGFDGGVIMPGMGAGGAKGSVLNRSMGAGASIAAATFARQGEGEEMVVGEMEGGGVGVASLERRKKGILGRDDDDGDGDGRPRPSMYQDDNEDDTTNIPAHAFVYDSDSSDEVKSKYRSSRDDVIPPFQLPFPIPLSVNATPPIMYECQRPVLEKEVSNGQDHLTEVIKNDPPLVSPFLPSNLSRGNKESSWMVLKLPTRLPRLDALSTQSGRVIQEKKNEDSNDPDQQMDDKDTSNTPSASNVSASIGTGYDDSLKDMVEGKYGKIRIWKSGKTELVLGGEEFDQPEIILDIVEGMQCGFSQQAVVIDPENGTYIPLGPVTKSLVVTPDVEGAF